MQICAEWASELSGACSSSWKIEEPCPCWQPWPKPRPSCSRPALLVPRPPLVRCRQRHRRLLGHSKLASKTRPTPANRARGVESGLVSACEIPQRRQPGQQQWLELPPQTRKKRMHQKHEQQARWPQQPKSDSAHQEGMALAAVVVAVVVVVVVGAAVGAKAAAGCVRFLVLASTAVDA